MEYFCSKEGTSKISGGSPAPATSLLTPWWRLPSVTSLPTPSNGELEGGAPEGGEGGSGKKRGVEEEGEAPPPAKAARREEVQEGGAGVEEVGRAVRKGRRSLAVQPTQAAVAPPNPRSKRRCVYCMSSGVNNFHILDGFYRS